ncbi:DUF3846 domain-containing protein [[Pseudomonas] carboxydohydrogena]|jgi:hypothetical protein|uniref:DUF3846 domain-containing protein n=1 Tax=Afipia carboxydohydrogena TaxID=290 RepID=A0ABY8BUC6_AFICR|nr:DUF3846 domain-containing protein [[Pseudomonas] carboxydohydrogena]WEF52002.1 DUF3846 domain-containing protein [[Pseudomonas] carboxydohydrogena]
MRAILIDPVRRVVEPYTIDHRLASLQAAVGGLIAWGTELKTGDVLYIDDEALLKPNPAFFALNGRTFPGCGLIVGPENPLITDVISTVEQVANMIRFNVDIDLDRALVVKSTTFDSADEFLEYLSRQCKVDRE